MSTVFLLICPKYIIIIFRPSNNKLQKVKVNELENNSKKNDFQKGKEPRKNMEKDKKNDLATDSYSILGR